LGDGVRHEGQRQQERPRAAGGRAARAHGIENAIHRQLDPLGWLALFGQGGGSAVDNPGKNHPLGVLVPGVRPARSEMHRGKIIAMNDSAKPVILVVEDDPDLRTILRMQLTCQDFIVREAVNGLEGFQSVQASAPDCVILDLMMPVLDGFGFLKRARSLMTLVDMPILILTASEDERNKVRGHQYQADSYMSKPYDLDALTDEVRRLLATRTPGRS
jgi:CheY-like chemotaxis protein